MPSTASTLTDVGTDEIQQILQPTMQPVIRVTPRTRLGVKRMRTSTATIEVPAAQEFRPEITEKDTEITRINELLKQKENLITELLEENRKLRKQLEEKNA